MCSQGSTKCFTTSEVVVVGLRIFNIQLHKAILLVIKILCVCVCVCEGGGV